MSAINWSACIAFTLAQEGGLVDDPSDPGGITNFGISKRAYPTLDIRALTAADANAIYHRDYWARIAGDSLPLGVDLMVFDEAVNASDDRSERILQRCLGVDIDGIIGPITLLAVRGADPARLIDALAAAQLAYYQSLPGWAEFGHDWGGRVARRQAQSQAMLSVPQTTT